MKQGSPVHFVARLFQPIAPNPQHMRRNTERCGILGVPHAAPVHRFDMHAPERLKSHRTAIRTHAVAIAPRPLGLFGCAFFGCRSGFFRCDFCKSSARLRRSSALSRWRAHRIKLAVERSCSAPRPARFDTRPQHGSTRTGCRPLPGNDEAPSEILHCSREAEMEREQNIRKMCRTRTVTAG
jgi:hypothetical protein